MNNKYGTTKSGLIMPYYIIKQRPRPTAFDFFCGAGGMGCGIMGAGYEIVGANEHDPYASMTYLVNLGHYPVKIHYIDGVKGRETLDKIIAKEWGIKGYKTKEGITPEELNKASSKSVAGSGWIKRQNIPGVRNFWFGDIRKLKGKDILDALGMKEGDLDLVAGGPPCQGYSRSGKQDINDPRNGLVYEYARMIVELQPKTFVMEEVPDIVNFFDPDGVPVIDKFCLMLQNGGYGKWDMLKKSLLMQAGTAAGIRSTAGPCGKSKETRKTAHKRDKQSQEPDEQLVLF